MFRTLAIRTGLLCLALAPFVTTASAQVKVAVINTQKAMADSEELKKASAEVEAKYKPRQDELNKLQADLQSIEQQLNSGKLNQQAAADLQAQGQRKQRDAQPPSSLETTTSFLPLMPPAALISSTASCQPLR